MSDPTDGYYVDGYVDHLLDLLGDVLAGFRLVNRYDEALLLVPADVLTEIRRVLGSAPDVPPKENR